MYYLIHKFIRPSAHQTCHLYKLKINSATVVYSNVDKRKTCQNGTGSNWMKLVWTGFYWNLFIVLGSIIVYLKFCCLKIMFTGRNHWNLHGLKSFLVLTFHLRLLFDKVNEKIAFQTGSLLQLFRIIDNYACRSNY